MTAAPTGEVMGAPGPAVQRCAGFTVEHVLALPSDAFTITLPIRDIAP